MRRGWFRRLPPLEPMDVDVGCIPPAGSPVPLSDEEEERYRPRSPAAPPDTQEDEK